MKTKKGPGTDDSTRESLPGPLALRGLGWLTGTDRRVALSLLLLPGTEVHGGHGSHHVYLALHTHEVVAEEVVCDTVLSEQASRVRDWVEEEHMAPLPPILVGDLLGFPHRRRGLFQRRPPHRVEDSVDDPSHGGEDVAHASPGFPVVCVRVGVDRVAGDEADLVFHNPYPPCIDLLDHDVEAALAREQGYLHILEAQVGVQQDDVHIVLPTLSRVRDPDVSLLLPLHRDLEQELHVLCVLEGLASVDGDGGDPIALGPDPDVDDIGASSDTQRTSSVPGTAEDSSLLSFCQDSHSKCIHWSTSYLVEG